MLANQTPTTAHTAMEGHVVLYDERQELIVDAAVTQERGRIVARVWLHGVLCAANAPVVAMAIERLLRLGAQDLSFDLGGLRLCTSDGFELWVRLRRRLDLRGGTVQLENASGTVRRALDACAPELAGAAPS